MKWLVPSGVLLYMEKNKSSEELSSPRTIISTPILKMGIPMHREAMCPSYRGQELGEMEPKPGDVSADFRLSTFMSACPRMPSHLTEIA